MSWLHEAKYDRRGQVTESTIVTEFDPMEIWTLVSAGVKEVHGAESIDWIRTATIRLDMEQHMGPDGLLYRPRGARSYVTVGKPR